jgi:hypothetical protein
MTPDQPLPKICEHGMKPHRCMSCQFEALKQGKEIKYTESPSLPTEPAKPFDNCGHCQSLICNDLGKCCDPKEPAKPEGETPTGMRKCYQDYCEMFPWTMKGDPDYDAWILSDDDHAVAFRQGWSKGSAELTALRAENSDLKKLVDSSYNEALRDENERLREWHDLINDPKDVPKLTGRYLVITGDGPRVVRVEETFTEFDDGTPTDPFEWSAWKEIVLPAAPESKGGEH